MKCFYDRILATGLFREPNCPEQFNSFSGPKMHCAKWDASISIENKVVGIVGCGATAMQVVPAVANKAKEVILFNRNAPYILPKQFNFKIPSFVQFLFRIFPILMWIIRGIWYLRYEIIAARSFTTNSLQNRLGKLKFLTKFAICDDQLRHINQISGRYLCNLRMRRTVKDKSLHEYLTPKYKFGCRIYTVSNSYYNTLNQSNVKLNTSKITQVSDQTIFTQDGQAKQLDVSISLY